jgi:hypothetical protein
MDFGGYAGLHCGGRMFFAITNQETKGAEYGFDPFGKLRAGRLTTGGQEING